MKIWYILPIKYPYLAMSICGVIIAKRGSTLSDRVINHEAIHWAQQKELFILPFFLLYLLEFLLRYILMGFKWDLAYRHISFEQEAFTQEGNEHYLKNCMVDGCKPHRKPYAWAKYF